MSKPNFFAALDDDDDDEHIAPVASKAKDKKPASKSGKPNDSAKSGDKGRSHSQNDRNTKHGRGGREPTRSGKRAYDRRSGTGRGREIKKDGGGARNWGSDKNEARNSRGPVHDSKYADDGGYQDDAPEPEPVEDNTMSYEEYMKQKQKPASGAFAPVQERKVDNDFANFSASVVEETDFLVMGGPKQQRKREGRESRQKQSIDVGFRVAPSDSNDRDDGGRGRGRGRGGRGGGRGGDGRGRGRGRGGGRGGREGRGGRDGRGGGRGRDGRERGGGRGRGRSGGRGGRDGAVNPMDGEAFPSL